LQVQQAQVRQLQAQAQVRQLQEQAQVQVRQLQEQAQAQVRQLQEQVLLVQLEELPLQLFSCTHLKSSIRRLMQAVVQLKIFSFLYASY
jgi:hypothetical protein